MLFKEEVAKSFVEIHGILKEKDQTIELLNKRIAALEAFLKISAKKQVELERKLDKIEHQLSTKTSPLSNEKVDLNQEPTTSKGTIPVADDNYIPIPAIPTSNNFSTLPDEHEDTISTVTNPDTTLPKDRNNSPTAPSDENKVITSETNNLCDSNGKHLDVNLLCTGTSISRCPTTAAAIKILEQHTFTNPKTIIIEHISNEAVSNNIGSLITNIRKDHPSCRIIISSLLPRSDHLLP